MNNQENIKTFDTISQVKVAIRGVDPEKTIILAVREEIDDEGVEKRGIRVFENADDIPVLNLPAIEMNIYSNGFRIIHNFEDSIAVKAYGIKTGLIITSCYSLGGKLIPYQITKSKKKDEEVNLEKPAEAVDLVRLLSEPVDVETLNLLYPQSKKADGLQTRQDAVTWLLERQSEITDINHHLQIDNVIIELLYK